MSATDPSTHPAEAVDATSTSSTPRPARLGALTVVLAAACGLSVANLYYAQPLLAPIAKSFHVGQGTAATVVTMTQLGYVVGLVTMLPLGDLVENRKLTSRVLVVTGAVLLASAFVPDFGAFLALSALVGMTSVVAQILIPLAAHLASDDERGRVIGRVMSGLLLGILLARTVASLVAAAWGWRSIFLISAVLMLSTSAVLARALPNRRPDHGGSYASLLRSVWTLARTQPILRRRAFCQAMMFGAFTAFWTSISYELIDDHHLSQTGIGVFALVGAAGAAVAPVAGKLADAGLGRPFTGVAIVLGSVAMLLADFGRHDLILLGLAGVLLDMAVQGHQVLNQREIYALVPEARARVNAVYMSSIFVGGALASAISGSLHDSHGWVGVTVFGAALPVLALLVWGYGVLESRRSVTPLPRG